ncbi:polymeric immunoglobulin receptor-like [Astyanax mexicanus]|uniref:polymeric immunoglobulin receptor-like n=1 Tax=Astyanax mexicanus TaxID=7994 RepID=UPI0020CAC9FA|nr:polymeric immunoglobulin receptor-like [Astyanax mexicanus]
MKILLISTFFLISGPAACFDVIGYSRGSIIIYCNNKQKVVNGGYFCKESTDQCVFLESDQTQNSWDHKDRVSVRLRFEYLRVFYKDLRLEDAGSYRCGETGGASHAVNLRVKTDPCCLGPKSVIGYLGETVTINCNYPEEFQTNNKTFNKQVGPYLSPMISTTDSQKGRFSISDNRRSRVISVRISDVREDGGVYYCGERIGRNEVSYLLLYTEIHLQVSASSPSIIIIIILSICVTLLLIGGLTLIFFIVILKKRQGSPNKQSGTNDPIDVDSENDPPRNNQNFGMDSTYQNQPPNINQSDSVYQSLDPKNNQSDSVYQTLSPNSNQADSVYQSLDPKTNQLNSVYHNLNPNANQFN